MVASVTPDDVRPYRRTSHAVWELTLKCNLACSHCGSRAGEARAAELSTDEALDVVRQLKEVGIGEVTLIGGEAFLRADWLVIARAIADAGMICGMTTGGYGISAGTARQMKDAGFSWVNVSVDGLQATHDRLRGRLGSWRACFQTLQHMRDAGLKYGANTQINRLSAPELPRVYERLRDAGIMGWQIQLTVPMGNAADRPDILLQPSELLDLYPMLARIVRRAHADRILVQPGNNIGYFGPYERLMRGQGNEWSFWTGCAAGVNAVGIEADGTLKGCPSLPTQAYGAGNLRERRMIDMIEHAPQMNFAMNRGTAATRDTLWGFCATCEFADICNAGCTWTSHVFFDRRGNNPYCHHRAIEHQRRGERERLVLRRRADGRPFDNGAFDILVEAADAPWPEDPQRFSADRIRWPESWVDA